MNFTHFATVAFTFSYEHAQFYFTLRNGCPAVDSNSGQRISLRIFRDAFARGSSRIVHWALLDGQRFVVKKYMGISQDSLLHVMEQVRTIGT